MDIHTKQCNRCNEYFPKETFEKYGAKRGICTECERIRQMQNQRKRYATNKEKYRDVALSWYRKDKEHSRELARARSKKNRLTVLQHYSNGEPHCACCEEKNILFLTIDHINNDGYKIRGKQKDSASGRRTSPQGSNVYGHIIRDGFPTDLQVLCYNCNCGKARNNGVCPHSLFTGT